MSQPLSYACYRLPYADRYTEVQSDQPDYLFDDYEQIGERSGFVIAPFLTDEHTPIVVIAPDRVRTVQVPDTPLDATDAANLSSETSQPDAAYAQAFAAFHEALQEGRFTKLVLARSKEVTGGEQQARTLFEEACRRYPRLMIMLFSTPVTGTWLIASPEVLIEGEADGCYRTMALAGTMPYREGYVAWSLKNQHEQQVVESYIEQILKGLFPTEEEAHRNLVKDGPATVRAGHLLHLRTEFRVRVNQHIPLGKIVAALHPTPAVCGLPKAEAWQFIARHEATPRTYYSGFAGPVHIDGATHLYVSLRCARLTEKSLTLYAGGGILPASQCESEWRETEAKMGTILSLCGSVNTSE